MVKQTEPSETRVTIVPDALSALCQVLQLADKEGLLCPTGSIFVMVLSEGNPLGGAGGRVPTRPSSVILPSAASSVPLLSMRAWSPRTRLWRRSTAQVAPASPYGRPWG